uniref:Peptidase C1A papain C-terminal domain-containing protein n=1 Tax=uncultured organism MedDCM-OCT-S01-C7 TaxID=743602 RepID=D6PJ06_9ZZZZ|nr:hypothetical protein [uncultured organism MedDCM-OCT-S01-C7]
MTWIYLKENNARQLELHLSKSPVTVELYPCNNTVWKGYASGVFKNETACENTHISTTAVVVGYGSRTNDDNETEEYWEILNSFGDDWGYKGRMMLARNVEWSRWGGQNGILTNPAYTVPSVRITENGDYTSAGRGEWYDRELGCKSSC